MVRGDEESCLGKERRGDERGVLGDDKVALVLVRDAELLEEGVGGLADDHRTEELATEPRTACSHTPIAVCSKQ